MCNNYIAENFILHKNFIYDERWGWRRLLLCTNNDIIAFGLGWDASWRSKSEPGARNLVSYRGAASTKHFLLS